MKGGSDIYVIDSDGEFDFIEIVEGGAQRAGTADSARSDRVTKWQSHEIIHIDISDEEITSSPAQKRRRVSTPSCSLICDDAQASSSDDDVEVVEQPPRQSQDLPPSQQEHMARSNQSEKARQPSVHSHIFSSYGQQSPPQSTAVPLNLASSEQNSQLRHVLTPSPQKRVAPNIDIHSGHRVSPMISLSSNSSLSDTTIYLNPDVTPSNQCCEFGVVDGDDPMPFADGLINGDVSFFSSVPDRSSWGSSSKRLTSLLNAVTARAASRRKIRRCSDAAISRASTAEAAFDIFRSGSDKIGNIGSDDRNGNFEPPPMAVYSHSSPASAPVFISGCHTSCDFGAGARKRLKRLPTIFTNVLLTEVNSGCFRDLTATMRDASGNGWCAAKKFTIGGLKALMPTDDESERKRTQLRKEHQREVALDSILSRLTAHQLPPIENSTMSGIREAPLPGGVLGLIELETALKCLRTPSTFPEGCSSSHIEDSISKNASLSSAGTATISCGHIAIDSLATCWCSKALSNLFARSSDCGCPASESLVNLATEVLVKHGTEACDENSVSGFGRNALAVDACKVAARCLGLLAAVLEPSLMRRLLQEIEFHCHAPSWAGNMVADAQFAFSAQFCAHEQGAIPTKHSVDISSSSINSNASLTDYRLGVIASKNREAAVCLQSGRSTSSNLRVERAMELA